MLPSKNENKNSICFRFVFTLCFRPQANKINTFNNNENMKTIIIYMSINGIYSQYTYINRYIGKFFVFASRKPRNACTARLRAENELENERENVFNCFQATLCRLHGKNI